MHANITHAITQLPGPPTDIYRQGAPSSVLMQRGSMVLKAFAPRSPDRQQPHGQDELYLVHSGTAQFVRAGKSESVQAGDALFVAAGIAHRFESFSEDFATWVVFYGPQGGEQA